MADGYPERSGRIDVGDPRLRSGLDRQHRLREHMLAAGARHVGWKLGFGSPGGLAQLNLRAPLVGFLTDRTVLPSSATVAVGDWTAGVVEFEVAVELGQDLPPGSTAAAARDAAVAVGPAIEIADLELDVLDQSAVSDILAGDIFHRGVVLGARARARMSAVLDGAHAHIHRNGQPFTATSQLHELTGDPGQILTVVADTLALVGQSLRAGDVVILGSVVPPIPVQAGDSFRFQLGRFEPLMVRFGGDEAAKRA